MTKKRQYREAGIECGQGVEGVLRRPASSSRVTAKSAVIVGVRECHMHRPNGVSLSPARRSAVMTCHTSHEERNGRPISQWTAVCSPRDPDLRPHSLAMLGLGKGAVFKVIMRPLFGVPAPIANLALIVGIYFREPSPQDTSRATNASR